MSTNLHNCDATDEIPFHESCKTKKRKASTRKNRDTGRSLISSQSGCATGVWPCQRVSSKKTAVVKISIQVDESTMHHQQARGGKTLRTGFVMKQDAMYIGLCTYISVFSLREAIIRSMCYVILQEDDLASRENTQQRTLYRVGKRFWTVLMLLMVVGFGERPPSAFAKCHYYTAAVHILPMSGIHPLGSPLCLVDEQERSCGELAQGVLLGAGGSGGGGGGRAEKRGQSRK